MTHRVRGLQGYTLIESIVVVGLIAAILAVAIPALYRTYQANRVQSAARTMAANLRFARMAAVKRKITFQVTVLDETEVSDPNTYSVQYDPSRSNSFVDYRKLETDIPNGVIIDSSSLNSLKFNSRGGAQPSGTILLIGTDSTKYNVIINIAGSVTIQKG